MLMSCPECESTQEVNLVDYKMSCTIKGINIEFPAKSYECSKCKEMFDTSETLDNNLLSARKLYDEICKKDDK